MTKRQSLAMLIQKPKASIPAAGRIRINWGKAAKIRRPLGSVAPAVAAAGRSSARTRLIINQPIPPKNASR